MASALMEVGTNRERPPFSQVLIIANRERARQFNAPCSRFSQR
jgi:hypothetical protein